MKPFMLWVCLLYVLLATPAHAVTSDTTRVGLDSGQTLIVTSDVPDPVHYIVTDADMARWARLHTNTRTIIRERVVHDTVSAPSIPLWRPYSNSSSELYDHDRATVPVSRAEPSYLPRLLPVGYTIDGWWPMLFMVGFLGLLAILVSGIWRDRHGRDGLTGRDGRDAPVVAQDNVPEGHWLSIGTLPEGTEITIKRDRQPLPPK